MSMRHGKNRNSTIKQEEQQNQNYDLENDSSIELHEDTDAHYYDLDYSDQHEDNNIVSSSDEDGREITHEEFMQMISTNQQQIQRMNSKYSQQEYEPSSSSEQQGQQFSHGHQRHHLNHQQTRFLRSNDIKNLQNQKKKFTPSTRDKSHNFYHYDQRLMNEKNDPEKSSGHNQKRNKSSKQTSFNNNDDSVRQFRIDSFLNSHNNVVKQKKAKNQSKAWKQFRQMKHEKRNEQDESFSLITLPQYQNQSISSLPENDSLQNQQMNEERKQRMRKYKNAGKMQQKQQNGYDKLNWRYQEAKLKFMDNFLPDSLKIGTNSFNMLKYMNRKHQVNYQVLSII